MYTSISVSYVQKQSVLNALLDLPKSDRISYREKLKIQNGKNMNTFKYESSQ